jgi:ATP/maltotriose-dependent transcriptional regulator MalT
VGGPAGTGGRCGAPEGAGITARERESLELIRSGCTNQEMADRPFISLATVKDHDTNIFK